MISVRLVKIAQYAALTFAAIGAILGIFAKLKLLGAAGEALGIFAELIVYTFEREDHASVEAARPLTIWALWIVFKLVTAILPPGAVSLTIPFPDSLFVKALGIICEITYAIAKSVPCYGTNELHPFDLHVRILTGCVEVMAALFKIGDGFLGMSIASVGLKLAATGVVLVHLFLV